MGNARQNSRHRSELIDKCNKQSLVLAYNDATYLDGLIMITISY